MTDQHSCAYLLAYWWVFTHHQPKLLGRARERVREGERERGRKGERERGREGEREGEMENSHVPKTQTEYSFNYYYQQVPNPFKQC